MDVSLSADRYAPVSVERVMFYANEQMRRRFITLPFQPTHAVVALFAGKVSINSKGGDYSKNKEVLLYDCDRLQKVYPSHHFYASGNAYPLPAVQAARLAGLGIIGLNGLLYSPGLGFSLTIGAILTDLPLSAGNDLGEKDGYCSRCGECIRQCPERAITYKDGIRRFEREKCLSHRRQKENVQLCRPGYFGCDICQDCCPMNP